MAAFNVSRRSFFTGLVAALAAPAVVKSGILMPVKNIVTINDRDRWSRVAHNYHAQAMNSRIEISHDGGLNWKIVSDEIVDGGTLVTNYMNLLGENNHAVLRGINQLRSIGGNNYGTA